MELIPEDQLILLSVKCKPSILEIDQLNDLIPLIQNWDYLIQTCINRGIGPLLYKKLPLLSNSVYIPENVKTRLHQIYYQILSRSTLMYDYFSKVILAFHKKNISVIALKGIYLSEWLYQDIGLRLMSDIDLLVKEEDGLNCVEILKNLGFKPTDKLESEFVKAQRQVVHYDPMVLNGISIEIHIRLHKSIERYHLDNDSIWQNVSSAVVNNVPAYTLGKFDLLIHLCIHLDKHFKEGSVQFTCFCDIVNLLERFSGEMDWEKLIEVCKNYNCEKEVFKYIVLSNRFMNATVPDSIIEDYKYLLSEEVERLFFKYLEGYGSEQHDINVSYHIVNLANLNSFRDKFRYSWDIVFPPKAFMIQKYINQFIIHNEKLIINEKTFRNRLLIINYQLLIKFWWLWYPYRWWVGVKGMIKLTINN